MGLVIPFRAFDLEQYYIYTAILLTILYCSRSTYTKIGTIQRRLAWPLRKDDTQIREAFYIFKSRILTINNILTTKTK